MTRSKRSNGEGSKSYDKTKQIYRAFLTTPAGNRITKSSKDETVVDAWLNEQRLLMCRNKHIEPSTLTVAEWFSEWLEVYAKANTRPRTFDRYKSLLDHTETTGDSL